MSGEYSVLLSPNPDFPELSSLVKVGADPRRGRFVEAVADIPPGTVVCREKGIALGIDPNVCNYCLVALKKSQKKSVPHCHSCEEIHKNLDNFEGSHRSELMELGLAALTVRVLLSHDVSDIQQCLEGVNEKNRFSHVMALKKGPMDIDFSVVGVFLDRFVKELKSHPSWSATTEGLFNKAFKEVFSRLTVNAHTVYSVKKTLSYSEDSLSNDDIPSGVGLFPISSIFNHSCHSNVFSFFVNDTFVFVSRGVRKGEELVDNYGIQVHSASFQQRQHFLNGRGFDCACDVCREGDLSNDHLFEDSAVGPILPNTSLDQVREWISSGVLDKCHIDLHRYLLMRVQGGFQSSESSPEIVECFALLKTNQAMRGIVSEPELISQYLMMASQFADSKLYSEKVIDWLRSALFHIRFLYCNEHPAFEASSRFLGQLKSGEELTTAASTFKKRIRSLFA